jgi:hypothetical protein
VRAQADHGACVWEQLVGGEVEERRGDRKAHRRDDVLVRGEKLAVADSGSNSSLQLRKRIWQ